MLQPRAQDGCRSEGYIEFGILGKGRVLDVGQFFYPLKFPTVAWFVTVAANCTLAGILD